MRVVSLLLWVLGIVVVLLALLRRLPRRRRPVPLAHDELVKDPVCQTYVVRSRAVSRTSAGQPLYFCSAECARRYLG